MWSNDSSNSLIVASPVGAMCQKSIPATDGGVYIAWVNETGSLYAQRMNVNGSLLWPSSEPSTDGILVLTRNLQYTYDFGLSVDSENNLLIGIDSGFNNGVSANDLPGGKAIAFKLSPEGEFLFGEQGIVVSPEGENVGQIYCTATSDNGVILSWSDDKAEYIRTVKLDVDGQALWGQGKITQPLSITVPVNGLVPDDNGGAILSFIYTVPPFLHPMPSDKAYRELFAQKFTSEGNNAWSQQVIQVYNSSQSSDGLTDGVICPVVEDGSGGAVFAIPAPNPDNSAQTKSYIQHVLSTGKFKYSGIGAALSTNMTNSELKPLLAYSANTDSTFAVYHATRISEVPGAEDDDTVFAQMIASSGDRVWSDEGIQLEEWYTDGTGSEAVGMYAFNGGAMAMWIPPRDRAQTENDTIRAAMFNEQGEYVWATQTVDLKTSPTQAASFTSLVNSDNDFAVVSWLDDQSTPVRAQNINEDGTLGE